MVVLGRKAWIGPCRILDTVLVHLSIILKATQEQLQSLNIEVIELNFILESLFEL